ncbi:hypothetical protein [Sphingomonas phyllosphaerae]|uniref:hypothetical protein n=1 Tax=Sphingomonas phyllosphaerae TaxID=257003 RepID=UPI0005BB7064|nr:hypothetical protein [Sphingomonas phyllosphaerae]
MRSRTSGWPEGLSDEEAVQRLQTLCMGACDGTQDLADDGRYKALRRALLNRIDLRPLAPAFVAAQPNLAALVRHLRETRERSARRDMVRAQFAPLLEEVHAPGPVSAAGWTGRASPREQALLVRALAPAALIAVERLIGEEVRLRDNGGPVEDDREEALSHLRDLHQALGELIELARGGQPLAGVLGRVQAIRQSAKVTVGRAAAAMPVTASALIAFAGVVGIADFFVGNVVVSLAAGGLAGNTVKDVMLKRNAGLSR